MLGLVGCGNQGPTISDLRQTVEAYLSAKTPSARCSFYSTSFRRNSAAVVLAGRCGRLEQMTSAEQAARLSQRVLRIHLRGQDQATVELSAVSPRLQPDLQERVRGSTTTITPDFLPLTSLDLVVEAGKWRINGTSAGASG